MDRFTKNKTAGQRQDSENGIASQQEKTKTSAGAEVTATAAPVKTRLAYRVLIRPLITEKSALLESKNKYSFIIANWATKSNVKTALKEMYGVNPRIVNIALVQGHRVRFGRSFGKRSDYKKAIVTLPAGQSIKVHAGV